MANPYELNQGLFNSIVNRNKSGNKIQIPTTNQIMLDKQNIKDIAKNVTPFDDSSQRADPRYGGVVTKVSAPKKSSGLYGQASTQKPYADKDMYSSTVGSFLGSQQPQVQQPTELWNPGYTKLNYDGKTYGMIGDTGELIQTDNFGMPVDNAQWMTPDKIGLSGLGSNVGVRGGEITNKPTGLWEDIKTGWNKMDAADRIGAITGGINMATGLWSAYNQNKYADKMAKLEAQRQGFYEQQVNRQNQRQDLAQANYNKSQGL